MFAMETVPSFDGKDGPITLLVECSLCQLDCPLPTWALTLLKLHLEMRFH